MSQKIFPGGNNINILWSFFFFLHMHRYVQLYHTISKHCHYIIITIKNKPFGDFTVRDGKSPFSKTLNHHFIYFDGRSHSELLKNQRVKPTSSSFRSKVKALELRGASKPMGDNIWVANVQRGNAIHITSFGHFISFHREIHDEPVDSYRDTLFF